MDNEQISEMNPEFPIHSAKETQPTIGCSVPILFIFVWINVIVIVSQTANWFIEQGLVEGSLRQDPGRWLISVGAGLGIVIPLGLLSRIRHPIYKQIFKTWALAGIVILLLVPTRWLAIPDSQGVASMQLIGLTVFNLVLSQRLRHSRSQPNQNARLENWFPLFSAFCIAGVLGLPWVVIGTLGSWMDTFLGVAVGFSTGTALLFSMKAGLLQIPEFNGSEHFFIKGIVISQLLVIFCAALGINGNEWVLLMVVPMVGWMAGLWLDQKPIFRNGFVWLVGLAFAWPLIWVDPDELSLIITLGQGELLDWIGTASTIVMVTGFLLIFISYFGYRLFRRKTYSGKWAGAGFIVVVILLAVVYGIRGTPGFYGEKLFVILRDQADLSALPDSMEYPQRREAVYRQLVEHADATQADLRRNLKNLGISYTPYYLVNAIEIDAGPLIRLWLSLNPAVDRILDNPILRPLPEPLPEAPLDSSHDNETPSAILWNLRMIQADHVWEDLNVRGKGIIIGQSDSGVQGNHPELVETYHGKNENGDMAWFDPWYQSSEPVDIGGHGTHTLGTILGKTVGVAPEAEWIGCVNLARNLGNPGYYLDCMQFMLAPFPQNGDPFKDGDPSRGAHVLNNSWGCPPVEGCDAKSLAPAVSALRKAGVFVVVSAGNSGLSGCGSVDSPLAIYQDVYTVGAVDGNGDRADFSSIGPVVVDGSQLTKPDILAPGEGIYSTFVGSGYNTLSGTSMAGPHVVGVVALMWSANPELIGKIDLTTQILNQTARAYSGIKINCDTGNGNMPSNISGYGIVDAYAAVRAALETKP